ncbi:MAG: hypothetical protein ACHRXM_06125 [Isosphaerales bacterium]
MITQLVKSWLTIASRQVRGEGDTLKDSRRRRARHNAASCEALEHRVVLSNGGSGSLIASLPGSLIGSLSHVGVVTTPIAPIQSVLPPIVPMAFAVGSSSWTQLNSDVKALESELQTLAAKSGVTIADLQSLTSDSQAISQAGFHFDSQTLSPVISELAAAVAGGSSTSQAQSDFSSLFSGSTVSASVIDPTFSGLVTAIQDSKVTPTDLSTVAADEAAIQTDLPKLGGPIIPDVDGLLNPGPDQPITVSVPAITVSVPPVAVSVPPNVTAAPIIAGPPIFIGPFGATGLLGSLSYVGVVTRPVAVFNQPVLDPPSSSTSAFSQLQADVQKLQSELQTLAAKSGVTIADLQSLTSDGQGISQAGFYFDPKALNPVISELAAAVAGGTSTSQAQKDFTALFGTSSVSASVIDTTFSDLVKAMQDSKVAPADLSAVAGDQAAIQTDLNNLHPGNPPGGPGTGIGAPGTGTNGSGGGSTKSTKSTGHHQKNPHPSHVVAHVHSAGRSHVIKPKLRKKG